MINDAIINLHLIVLSIEEILVLNHVVKLYRETSCLPNLMHLPGTIVYHVSRSKPEQCNYSERSSKSY